MKQTDKALRPRYLNANISFTNTYFKKFKSHQNWVRHVFWSPLYFPSRDFRPIPRVKYLMKLNGLLNEFGAELSANCDKNGLDIDYAFPAWNWIRAQKFDW